MESFKTFCKQWFYSNFDIKEKSKIELFLWFMNLWLWTSALQNFCSTTLYNVRLQSKKTRQSQIIDPSLICFAWSWRKLMPEYCKSKSLPLLHLEPLPHITIEAFASLKTKLALKSDIPHNSEIPWSVKPRIFTMHIPPFNEAIVTLPSRKK